MTPSAPYDVESMINKRLQCELQKVNSFKNSIQNISLMMKYYELKEIEYKQKYPRYKLTNNTNNSTDGLIIIGTTSASITLSITGVGIIVVPITAGVGCATGIRIKICSSYLKKKEQNYKLKYAIIQKTPDDFRQLFTTSLKYIHIDEKEYDRFVNVYENSRVASHIASHTKSHTKSHTHTTSHVAFLTPPTIPLKSHNFL